MAALVLKRLVVEPEIKIQAENCMKVYNFQLPTTVTDKELALVPKITKSTQDRKNMSY